MGREGRPMRGLRTDHVTSRPMRGITKTASDGTHGHTDTETGMTVSAKLRRFSEN